MKLDELQERARYLLENGIDGKSLPIHNVDVDETVNLQKVWESALENKK